MLWNPDPTRQFAIATDASLAATRAVLLQTDENGVYHPCGYLSQSFNPAKRNYEIFNRELLAVICALSEWRHYLEGSPHPVIVFTDHMNLLYFHTAQKLSRHQACWQLTLSNFDLELHHVLGTKLAAPDTLSRCPYHSLGKDDNEDRVLLPDSMFIRLLDSELATTISDESLLNPIFATASDALNRVCLPPMKSLLLDWKLDGGVLFYKIRVYVCTARDLHGYG